MKSGHCGDDHLPNCGKCSDISEGLRFLGDSESRRCLKVGVQLGYRDDSFVIFLVDRALYVGSLLANPLLRQARLAELA
jgi:hypothetical protein